MTVITPGGTIGILGGGQLGRMTALAAASLGYRCHVLAPEEHSPAADVSAAFTRAAWDDQAALDAFAEAVDVVTLEFENVPVAVLERLARKVPVRPGPSVLEVTQDRLAEKAFVNRLGIATAPWRPITDEAGIAPALAELGGRGVLKTTRMGYDGKGQALLRGAGDIEAAWRALGPGPLILEGFVEFAMELSVITARGPDGQMASFVPVENRHRDHILKTTLAPAPITLGQAQAAVAMAERLTSGLEAVGLIAVEMFLASDGRLLVNELAPRPHNSGHWTMDACHCSQFEQLVRAVCGLPLGDPTRISDARMENLLGEEADSWREILAEPGARLHLYGKREARPGRKMGHVNRLLPRP
ncbi:5-(carboxyamino)imidazole ribonucleotide synthase [Marinimicrococcus flavescens]|uniref:N5-carboxyaminoimidazole ribonucleotide synthase n=1 Tax=Marinimicrococcus flavescens TaxID=3031815 RepID=A0AAP3UZR5_9PROT|nr:5-(carboxyamino)imidazole ribonucleotide synthase [Marinimicrococcus flavescens]